MGMTWEKPVVLTMDDKQEMRSLVREHFTIAGYQVEQASTIRGGKSLVDKMKGQAAIAILDWRMQLGDSSALLSYIAENAEHRMLAYVLTGDPTPGLAMRAISAGAHRFFVKDVNPLDYIQKCIEADFKLMRGNVLDRKTGLFNSFGFKQTVVSELITMRDRPEMKVPDVCTMLFIDADHFKLINDTQGHDIGDKAIIAIGNTLRKLTRQIDHLCRLQGDEFAVWLSNMGEVDALAKSMELQEGVRQASFIGKAGKLVDLSITVGAAEIRKEDIDADVDDTYYRIRGLADERMLEIKKARKQLS